MLSFILLSATLGTGQPVKFEIERSAEQPVKVKFDIKREDCDGCCCDQPKKKSSRKVSPGCECSPCQCSDNGLTCCCADQRRGQVRGQAPCGASICAACDCQFGGVCDCPPNLQAGKHKVIIRETGEEVEVEVAPGPHPRQRSQGFGSFSVSPYRQAIQTAGDSPCCQQQPSMRFVEAPARQPAKFVEAPHRQRKQPVYDVVAYQWVLQKAPVQKKPVQKSSKPAERVLVPFVQAPVRQRQPQYGTDRGNTRTPVGAVAIPLVTTHTPAPERHWTTAVPSVAPTSMWSQVVGQPARSSAPVASSAGCASGRG